MKNKYLLNSVLLFLFISLAGACSDDEIRFPDRIKIQNLTSFKLDGDPGDWSDVPWRKLYADPVGNYPQPDDLSADFKIAWHEDKLILLFKIEDDHFQSDTLYPWEADAVQIFLGNFRGSENIIQYSIVTGDTLTGEAVWRVDDHRKTIADDTPPGLTNRLSFRDGYAYLEAEIFYPIFDSVNNELPVVQVYVNDGDKGEENEQLTWYPLGHSYVNSFAFYELELTESENTLQNGASRLVITDDEIVDLYVFGCKQGDRITVKTDDWTRDFNSESESSWKPDNMKLDGLDIENDSLWVFINDSFVNMHNLFLAPRNYKEKKALRFDREIRLFRMRDRMSMPESGGTLFIGSSSIRMWNSIYNDFPELRIIHRGFGGSNSQDALANMEYIVLPYKPSRIVYYEGDNDIAQGMSYEDIISNMEKFIQKALKQNPDVEIYLISPKPSIRRMHLWDKYLEIHKRMRNLADFYPTVYFVDVASLMFSSDGELQKQIFVEDGIHMNESGYQIWKEILRDKLMLEKLE